MRRTTYYVFHSATVPDLRGITADPDGATLPASGGPWVAERDDPQTLVTARVNDRQILNILADRIGLFRFCANGSQKIGIIPHAWCIL
jgi:hypothetical protein